MKRAVKSKAGQQNRKSKAGQQYRKSKDSSKYKQLAQKLAQHLQKLQSNPYSKYKWIWQLIQNAKDVPNRFNKTKIKILVKDKSLQFSHNGDEFRQSDLQSIVNQYSSKKEKTQDGQDVTGRYGTGFISTYLLSRFITIQGIIKSQFNNSSDQDSQLSQEESQQIDKIQGRKIRNKNQFEELQEADNDDQNDDQNEEFSLSKFTIHLNRDYKNRQQFYKKLMKNQENIEKSLQNDLQEVQKWQRNEDSYDTIFTYQKIDKTGFNLIQQGIKRVKDLFPYALLFNQKLYQISIQDCRNQRKFKDFIIRKDHINSGIVSIFSCKIIQFDSSNKQESIFRIAFQQDKKTQSILAVPIKIEQQVKHIEQIPKGTPKIFKEFPLFGSQSIEYNYIFTSKKMYPNENRSTLQLENNIQGRKSDKVEKNKQILDIIFKTAINFFSCLKIFIKGSAHNFLNLKFNNYLGYQSKYYKDQYVKFRNNIMNFEIFQDQQGELRSINQLHIICLEQNKFSLKTMSISMIMNKMFSFLFPSQNFLEQTTYLEVYRKFYQYNSQSVHTLSLNDCISKLAQLSYDKLIQMFDDQSQGRKKIHQIYQFLLDNKINQLSCNSHFKIFLTKSKEFKLPQTLKVQGDIDMYYLNLLSQIQLMEKFDKFLIDQEYQNYFINDKLKENKIPMLTHQFIMQNIKLQFSINELIKSQQKFLLFLKLIQSFGLFSQFIDFIKQLKIYSKIQSFNESFQQIQLTDQDIQSMENILFVSFYSKIINKFNNNTLKQLKDLSNILKTQNQEFSIIWFNKLLQFQQNSPMIQFNISEEKKFKKSNLLKRAQKNEIQKEDRQFYNMVILDLKTESINKNKTNLYILLKQKSSLQSYLLHSKVTFYKNIQQTSYEKQFLSFGQYYDYLSNKGKKQYHKYVQRLMNLVSQSESENNHSKVKLAQFENFLSRRNIQYLQLYKNQFSKQQLDIIYNLISNKKDLQIINRLKKQQKLSDIETIINNCK